MEKVLRQTALLALIAVMGCASISQTIDPTKLRPPYTIVVYEAGRPVAKRAIAAGSDEESAVTQWIESNKSGWHATPATYAPHWLVNGDGFTLNFGNGFCVLNYSPNGEGNGGHQVYKTVPKENFELSDILSTQK